MRMRGSEITPGVWIFCYHPPVICGNPPVNYRDAPRDWKCPVHRGTDALVNSVAPQSSPHCDIFLKVEGVMISSHLSPKEDLRLHLEKFTSVFLCYVLDVDGLNQRHDRSSSIHRKVNVFADELTGGLNLVPYGPAVGGVCVGDVVDDQRWTVC